PLRPDGVLAVRASKHPDRRRVRCVAAVADDGIATVLRFEDEPDQVVAEAGRGIGDVIDALEAMWFGDPTLLTQRFVNMRTTRGGCARRP
ncbi:MAG TPA: hypothetical protein PLV68_16570, partial [Ilumatobacteraceae bacterium]|nr:hypothetical protein [Ilumatobacteraceae bacterium]